MAIICTLYYLPLRVVAWLFMPTHRQLCTLFDDCAYNFLHRFCVSLTVLRNDTSAVVARVFLHRLSIGDFAVIFRHISATFSNLCENGFFASFLTLSAFCSISILRSRFRFGSLFVF